MVSSLAHVSLMVNLLLQTERGSRTKESSPAATVIIFTLHCKVTLLSQALTFVESFVSKGESVLVHCLHGKYAQLFENVVDWPNETR